MVIRRGSGGRRPTPTTTPDHLASGSRGESYRRGTVLSPLPSESGSTSGTAVRNPDTGYWAYVDPPASSSLPTLPSPPRPRSSSSGGSSSSRRRSYRSGGGGGGGGGGGPAGPNVSSIVGLLNQYRPQTYTHTPLVIDDYQGQPFYEFDNSKYVDLQRRIREGAEADLASGNAAIDEAIAQINATPLAFQGGLQTRDPGMSDAMQRMMRAQGFSPSLNQRTLDEGVQADAAMGNVFALLAATEQQKRASDLLALEGDRRRMTENIQAMSTGMDASVALSMANALEQYKKDKWAYGESVARANWEKNMQVSVANNQAVNQARQANIQAANEANMNAMNAMIELAMAGKNPTGYNPVKV